jgi:2'-hydroxyisoflavone reductase
MKILILGGTVFVGRYLVERALQRGHELTLFNRGQQNADLFPQLEKLRGDRDVDADVSILQGRQFDAVIDTCAYRPEQIRRMASVLDQALPFYLFISTISVYGTFPPAQGFDENKPLAEGESDYGSCKARCEEAAEAAWPGRVAQVRPGLIVGPHDVSERFPYWPRRVAQGGPLLAPGQPDNPVQWIDVRDLANWCIHLCEQGITGPFNAIGPLGRTSFADLLARCKAVTHSDAEPIWIDDATLLAQGVAPWTELPLWLPQQDGESGGMMRASNQRALANGLSLRPLDETIADTLAWDNSRTRPLPDHPKAVKTMLPEREAALLTLLTLSAAALAPKTQ